MKISLNHLRHCCDAYSWSGDPAPDGLDALVERIGAQLGAVEEVIAVGQPYQDVVIVKVMACEDHPNADRLHVCKVDDGGIVQGVERDEHGWVQVVCGAPNVREGMLAAWLPPGSTVPSTYHTDPFVLEARALRGVVSNGMMASPKELALGDSHEGILEIEDQDIQPGTYFADAFGLRDDAVIDMENKMFTHRPDCFGLLGVAREIAGIQQQAFKSPAWYDATRDFSPMPVHTPLPLEVRNELPELVPRFVALPISSVTVRPSPVWLQVHLSRLGIRPINNVVDLTNYYMVLTGQPLHAYDYDKVVARGGEAGKATIVVRHPKQGEKILLLNGKEIEPRSEAIMIATDTTLIGIGGVMGGADTEVDENTKNIILECANFDMYSIRRTSMAHGLFTDAVTRFNKGQSPLQNVAVIAKIAEDISTIAGGQVAGELIDDNHLPPEVMQRNAVHPAIEVTTEFINNRLGFKLSVEDMSRLLHNVEFDVQITGGKLRITAPFWRTDIAIPEDIVEEVGRLYGFDHLPLQLPKRDLTPTSKDTMLELKARMRTILARAGANELLTYTFVHGNILNKAGQDMAKAYQLSNALSPDLQYFRLSLTPSLLERIHPNVKAGFDEFALFEINKTHNKDHVIEDNKLPTEVDRLALVVAVSDKKASGKRGAAYYDARAYLDYVASVFGLQLEYVPITTDPPYPVARPFDYKRSALAVVRGTDIVLGIIGEYRQSVQKGFKLPARTAGFEIALHHILDATAQAQPYMQLPRYPKVEQDVSLRVPADVRYQQLADLVEQQIGQAQLGQVLFSVRPLDIYQGQDAAYKNITFRVSIASYERTLTAEVVNEVLDTAAAAAADAYGASRL